MNDTRLSSLEKSDLISLLEDTQNYTHNDLNNIRINRFPYENAQWIIKMVIHTYNAGMLD